MTGGKGSRLRVSGCLTPPKNAADGRIANHPVPPPGLPLPELRKQQRTAQQTILEGGIEMALNPMFQNKDGAGVMTLTLNLSYSPQQPLASTPPISTC